MHETDISKAVDFADKIWQYGYNSIFLSGLVRDEALVRRTISTAYYSVFHLTTLGASNAVYSDNIAINIAARSFAHSDIHDAYQKLKTQNMHQERQNWNRLAKHFSSCSEQSVTMVNELADHYIHLYSKRQDADYNHLSKMDIKDSILCITAAKRYRVVFEDLLNTDFQAFERLVSILLLRRQSKLL